MRVFHAVGLMLALGATTVMAKQDKVTVCHNGRTLAVAEPALQAHLGHGDHRGECRSRAAPRTEHRQPPLSADEQYQETIQETIIEITEPAAERLPWGPPAGERARYHYRYYPYLKIYFDMQRELYFYYRRDRWIESVELPPALHVELGDQGFVELAMMTDYPYDYHQEVAEYYADELEELEELEELDLAISTVAPPNEAPWLRGDDELQRYYYYPQAEVYFSPSRELFFYREQGHWLKAPAPVDRLKRKLGYFIAIDMRTSEPYHHHSDIVEAYGVDIDVGAHADVYEYRYYPEAMVYYDEVSEVYYYRENERWLSAPALSQSLLQSLGAFVSFALSTRRPYERHEDILTLYRTGALAPRIVEIEEKTSLKSESKRRVKAEQKRKAKLQGGKKKPKAKARFKAKGSAKANKSVKGKGKHKGRPDKPGKPKG